MRLIPDDTYLHFPHQDDCSDPFSNPMILLSDSVLISDGDLNDIVQSYYGDICSKSQMNRKVEQRPFSELLKIFIELKREEKRNENKNN